MLHFTVLSHFKRHNWNLSYSTLTYPYLPVPVLFLSTFCSLSVSWLLCLESDKNVSVMLSGEPFFIQSLSKHGRTIKFSPWCSLTAWSDSKISPSKREGEQWEFSSVIATLSSKQRSEIYSVSPNCQSIATYSVQLYTTIRYIYCTQELSCIKVWARNSATIAPRNTELAKAVVKLISWLYFKGRATGKLTSCEDDFAHLVCLFRKSFQTFGSKCLAHL